MANGVNKLTYFVWCSTELRLEGEKVPWSKDRETATATKETPLDRDTPPPDRDPPGQRLLRTEDPLDRDPPDRDPPGTETSPGKQRAVRILLECILVGPCDEFGSVWSG